MDPQTPPPAVGRLRAWRARWLGEVDPVDAQLAAISREGAHMAHVGHAISFLLVVLFSAGSLAALGADALTRLQAQLAAGHVDIPSALSLAVSTLVVAAMDVAMLNAAKRLRLLTTRRGTWSEKALHVAVMVLVCALEAATYCYMSFRFETPATWIAGAIIVGRAGSAPLLSVYLALSQPLPVTSRDIMAQVELTQGRSLIRDFVVEAANPDVTLADKLAMYKASTQGLDALLAAAQARHSAPVIVDSTPPPTDGGTPATLASADRPIHMLPAPAKRRKPAQRRRAAQAAQSPAEVEAKVRAAWAVAPLRPGKARLSNTQLQRAAGISSATASKWVNVLKREDDLEATGPQQIAR